MNQIIRNNLLVAVQVSTMFVLLTCLIFLHPGFGFPSGFSNPPSPFEAAKMARYIMQSAEWASIATISTQSNITGYPYVALKSVSDGPPTNSTGIPYLYLTDVDVSGHDLNIDNRCSIMASLAESDYCKQQHFDPQDPRCAKLILTGKIHRLDNTTQEYKFGLNALYAKHPSMKSWPEDHHFYVAKLEIELIEVLDFFGGIKHVSLSDYFSIHPEWQIQVQVIDIYAK